MNSGRYLKNSKNQNIMKKFVIKGKTGASMLVEITLYTLIVEYILYNMHIAYYVIGTRTRTVPPTCSSPHS